MKKKTFLRIMMILLASGFLLCAGVVAFVQHGYKANARLYKNASTSYTSQNTQGSSGSVSGGQGDDGEKVIAPIKVDFEALQKANPEVIGWLYCPDTTIDFPICRAEDNDYYIDHNYEREYSPYGAIFADCMNRPGFEDSNYLIYGHHLTDGSMFAILDKWLKQDFFDEHPIMWILTPEQDYRVELFSAYYIEAIDEAYTIFQGPSQQFDRYLQVAKNNSKVTADVELDGNAKYVMFSTCAYVFYMARSVVHGKMVPVDSAGGVLIP